MSHADRDWWRDEGATGSARRVFGWGRTPAVWTLLGALLTVWLVDTGGRAEIGPGGLAGRVHGALSLSVDAILSRFEAWRLATYGGLHEPNAIRAFAWTALLLLAFGRAFEREAGWRRTLAVFASGVVLAGLLWVALARATGDVHSIADPSGGTLALVVARARREPRERWGPLPLASWAAIAVLARGIDLALSGGASSAMLVAGAAAGWGLGGAAAAEPEARTVKRTPTRVVVEDAAGTTEPDRRRLDALLAKISAEGLASLSDEERAFLDRESKRVRGARKT